ncbi:MAG: agmatine deiminase [Pseudomonadota bacterium]
MTFRHETTPREDGYRMPGEFEQHRGCWMCWPERPDNWRLGAKPAQSAFTAVAEAINESEPVTVAVSSTQFNNARGRLSGSIRVVEMSYDDSWMRDVGPSFVVNDAGDMRAVDWDFNGWGGHYNGLYYPWDKDDDVAMKVAEIEGADRYRSHFVLEGGSIHVDGEGTLITTEECLLSPGRNPDKTKEEIEAGLKKFLNLEKVLWVPRGVHLDETTGHVDNLLHYCAPGVVALTWTDDTSDPQYERSMEAYDYLCSVSDAKGRGLTIHKIHQPGPLFLTAEEAEGIDLTESGMDRAEGDRLAGSYCNFYIGNDRIVFPLLDESRDESAKEKLQEIFPGRKIMGIPGREILLGGGNIHCITQQVPK